MGKETEYSTYDKVTIATMLNMVMDMKEKIQQAMVLHDELAWMLYAGRQDPSMTDPRFDPVRIRRPGGEENRRHTFETEKVKPQDKPIKLTGKVDKRYAFCKSVDTMQWHIRKLTERGKVHVGPCDTRSLCDTEVVWDEYIPVTEPNIQHNSCMQCAIRYRRLQGEDYANRKTDQHEQEEA